MNTSAPELERGISAAAGAHSLHPVVVPPVAYYRDDYCTIYCGDAREIVPKLPAHDLCVTDPPFNVGKNYEVWNDQMPDAEYEDFLATVVRDCMSNAQKQAWVLPEKRLYLMLSLLKGCKLVALRRGAVGPKWGMWSNQFNLIGVIGQPNRQTPDLWEGIRLKGEGYFFREETYGHPGYTPEPLMAKCISILSEKTILDPFCGTGTSLAAAKKQQRRATGIEINERYCEIAAKRLAQEQLPL